jgi:hypothetical protein
MLPKNVAACASAGDDALGFRRGESGADQLDHLLDRKSMREFDASTKVVSSLHSSTISGSTIEW